MQFIFETDQEPSVDDNDEQAYSNQDVDEGNNYNADFDTQDLSKSFKFSKVFRLHAILHDAADFVKEHSGKGPGYFYFANCCGLSSCYIGHISGLFFCLYIKFFKPLSFKQLEC